VTPEELLYSKTHEWVRLETDATGGKIATVGISAFALEQLTDLVYVDLPEVGRRVTAGEPFGEIESVKAVSDLYSPVDGEIIEVNGQLADHLDTLSDDPYGTGWFVKIKLSDDSGLANLLDHAAYRKQCEEETTAHE
jgi:glycine cleavage system H protein